jgi:hypothetical protein
MYTVFDGWLFSGKFYFSLLFTTFLLIIPNFLFVVFSNKYFFQRLKTLCGAGALKKHVAVSGSVHFFC